LFLSGVDGRSRDRCHADQLQVRPERAAGAAVCPGGEATPGAQPGGLPAAAAGPAAEPAVPRHQQRAAPRRAQRGRDQNVRPDQPRDPGMGHGAQALQELEVRIVPVRGLVHGLWNWSHFYLPLLAPPGKAAHEYLNAFSTRAFVT